MLILYMARSDHRQKHEWMANALLIDLVRHNVMKVLAN
jgi:hypothetical protein